MIGHFLPSVIFQALAPAMPGRLIAGGADSSWLNIVRGQLPGSADWFTLSIFQAGGTGARAAKDGLSATGFPTGVAGVPARGRRDADAARAAPARAPHRLGRRRTDARRARPAHRALVPERPAVGALRADRPHALRGQGRRGRPRRRARPLRESRRRRAAPEALRAARAGRADRPRPARRRGYGPRASATRGRCSRTSSTGMSRSRRPSGSTASGSGTPGRRTRS